MTRRNSVEHDLAQWVGQQESAGFASRPLAGSPLPESAAPPGELAERLSDHLRLEEVADAYAAARGAAHGPEGEQARFKLRCLARPFLETSCAVLARQIGFRSDRQDPRALFESRLAREKDPIERRRLYREWLNREEDWAPWRQEFVDLYDQAARTIGAASVTDLLLPEHPVSVPELTAVFESGALEPLDDAVQSAARSWWTRRQPGNTEHELAELFYPGGPADDDPGWGSSRFPSILGQLARPLGTAHAPGGNLTLAPPDSGLWPRLGLLPGVGAFLQLGWWPGTRGLARALALFGRGARAGFLADVHGEAWARWSDPAFGHAAETLFRRLVLNGAFRSRFGLDESPGRLEELRFEEALAPRLAWTYVSWVLEIPKGEPREPLERLFLRSTGRPPTILQRRTAAGRDPFGASALRGTVLGLLLEERLLSRFGHGWSTDGGALRLLQEYWDAEPGQTAESLASALDLGTIEPTPILDACRPGPS